MHTTISKAASLEENQGPSFKYQTWLKIEMEDKHTSKLLCSVSGKGKSFMKLPQYLTNSFVGHFANFTVIVEQ